MPFPNIKIGTSTYNDISHLRVDKIEGGTADYIYSGLFEPKVLAIIKSNITQKQSTVIVPINISTKGKVKLR